VDARIDVVIATVMCGFMSLPVVAAVPPGPQRRVGVGHFALGGGLR
jgi:hypothetical protein